MILRLLPGAPMLCGEGPVVAGGSQDDKPLLPEGFHAADERGIFIKMSAPAASDRDIDDPDIILSVMSEQPADSGKNIFDVALPLLVENLDHDKMAVRSDALVAFSAGVAVSGDDSCNMRAMSVVIIKVRTMVYGIHKGF